MGFKEQIATVFKEAREKAGMTQSEVSEKAGIHVNYYARVERGEVVARGDVLSRIAKALGIKVNLPL